MPLVRWRRIPARAGLANVCRQPVGAARALAGVQAAGGHHPLAAPAVPLKERLAAPQESGADQGQSDPPANHPPKLRRHWTSFVFHRVRPAKLLLRIAGPLLWRLVKKKPTWSSTVRYSTTSAYSRTGLPTQLVCPLISLPTTEILEPGFLRTASCRIVFYDFSLRKASRLLGRFRHQTKRGLTHFQGTAYLTTAWCWGSYSPKARALFPRFTYLVPRRDLESRCRGRASRRRRRS